MRIHQIIPLSLILFSCNVLKAQTSDSLINSTISVPNNFLLKINNRYSALASVIERKADKALKQIAKREERIKRKLLKTNPVKAQEIFGKSNDTYDGLLNIQNDSSSGNYYIPYLDSINTSLAYLNQIPHFKLSDKGVGADLYSGLSTIKKLQSRLKKSDDIKRILKERKEYLQAQLTGTKLGKQVANINKDIYYYSASLSDIKEAVNNPKRAEKKLIAILSKTKAFKDFMKKNSLFASLFRVPTDATDQELSGLLSGMQTREMINEMIQGRIASGGPNAQSVVQQNIQEAQGKIRQLQNKVFSTGSGNSEDIPEFRPNTQKSKTFLKRLEYGTNFQMQRGTDYFPVTSDIGLSVGYKLNDKATIGVGASYKIGWGKGWNGIKVTNEGAGLRSYGDVKLKGSFWLSGGFEMNYRTSFAGISQLREVNNWQQSGLVGISKVISAKTKFFKKAKIQLLWDFLSYQHIPATQPFVFRVGYNIK